jgi:hypothetical protein
MRGILLAFALYATLARCAALARIRSSHLIRPYRWFAIYLLAGIAQNGALLFKDRSDPWYAAWWVRTLPLVIVASIAAVIELWFLLMSNYRGVERIYSWLVPAVVGASIAVMLFATADVWILAWQPTIYRVLTLAFRYCESALTVACAFLACWAFVFFHQVPRNVKVHAVLLTVNLASLAAGNTVIVLLGGRNKIAGPAMASVSASCFVLWALLISSRGQAAGAPPAPLSEKEREQVDARERELLKTRRYFKFPWW